MTLTQRLTRAGATFIILGLTAALLPHQADSAIADNGCTIGGHTFAIKNSVGTASSTYALGRNSSDTYKSFYDSSTQEGVITATDSGSGATFGGNGTSSVVVTTPNADGTVSLSASDASRGAQYIATATISY